MRIIVIAVIILWAVLADGMALGATPIPQAMISACSSDAFRFCSAQLVLARVGFNAPIRACMLEHAKDLSAPCKEAMNK